MNAICANEIKPNGSVLPRISSNGRSGVTINCSIVPVSRSRTIAIDVSIRQVSRMMNAITPGT